MKNSKKVEKKQNNRGAEDYKAYLASLDYCLK